MSLVNILVENLSGEINENDLEKSFEKYGKVSSVSIVHEKNKMFAYVSMAKQNEADAAVKGLNNKELKGIKLKVSEAPVYWVI